MKKYYHRSTEDHQRDV